MAFAVAKFWGLLPDVIWGYPFRYYKELRDFYVETLQPLPRVEEKSDINFDDEIFRGDSI